ncbi:hypothetical protein BKA65DRAFT_558114 [Rhexocercosporidium sp. MPI-PUGE-AT-0058]|nr:hypothetical protein BKA65DRAFT_558114 [Rhexocercosporidium sp. MPI-PUGE-AT-0058]
MPKSSKKVHEVHCSSSICSVEVSYHGQILVEETPTGKNMAFVRSKPSEKTRIPAQSVQRRVFLVSIPSQSYSGIFSGTPMMRHYKRHHDPWPLLENDVHILRYWILCLVNDDGEAPPTRAQLLDADFFDCSQEPLLRGSNSVDQTTMFKLPTSIVETIEAIQELGRTSHSNSAVKRQSDSLNGLWGTYYPILWNSQQFSVRLSYLIIQPDSLPAARLVVNSLLARLDDSTWGFVAARHIGFMVAFTGFGLATCGIGVFAAWSTAGGSMISHDIKNKKVLARIADLEANFPRLREI